MIPPGATVLTANQRLARTLRKDYDDSQVAGGRTAWASPPILPFNAWLRECWSDAALSGSLPVRRLLTSAQAETLWRNIIEHSAEGRNILDLRGAAQSAMRAWELVHQYRLPLDGRYAAHEDWNAFHGWAHAYARQCESRAWTDEARLPDHVREALEIRAIPTPEDVVLAGFDEFTPQQKEILGALPHFETLTPETTSPHIVQIQCSDSSAELEAAAHWASQHPGSRVGIVLLSAGTSRVRIERAFEAVDSFHISMGEPLAGYPLISVALLVLRLAGLTRWTSEDAGRLLRCPYIAGGIEHACERALTDVQIRRWRRAYVAPRSAKLGDAWLLHETGDRPPSEWTRTFQAVLQAIGFPGDRALSSHEYQIHQAWSSLLVEFESLDVTAQPVSYGSAVERLRELAADTQFQPQDPGARLQILGPLEAAGARFDHLWICGAIDQTWPAPAHPHPFLPLSLQRERSLPHSSPEREFEFALQTFARLKASAPDVVVSWPRRAGDVEFRPSPLLAEIPRAEYRPVFAPPPPPALIEERVDELAPPLETIRPRGGTTVLRLQSACPFRAFADLRLGARPLESGELGLSAADRGRAIHKALEMFWGQVAGHDALCSLHPESLAAIARESARRRHQRRCR
jgi:ATP-dependent helicase/nuclease subunit B